MGGRGAVSPSYQGTNKGSGKAYGEKDAFAALSDIEKSISEHPKVAEGDEEAMSVLEQWHSDWHSNRTF